MFFKMKKIALILFFLSLINTSQAEEKKKKFDGKNLWTHPGAEDRRDKILKNQRIPLKKPFFIIWHNTGSDYKEGDKTANDNILHGRIEKRNGKWRKIFWQNPCYHVIITDMRDFQIQRGKRYAKFQIIQDEKFQAMHVSPHWNSVSLSIAYEGSSRPTPEQLRTMRAITLFWMEKYDIPPRNILGHREVGSHEDPVGIDMERERKLLKKIIEKRRGEK